MADNFLPELWGKVFLNVMMRDEVLAGATIDGGGDFHRYEDVTEVFGKQVKLDQLYWVSFEVKDSELGKSLDALMQVYVEPAAKQLASRIRADLVKHMDRGYEGKTTVLVTRPHEPTDRQGRVVNVAAAGGRVAICRDSGLAVTVEMRYSGVNQQMEIKFSVLAAIAAAESTNPVRLVRVAETRKEIVEAIEKERAYQDKRWGTEFDDKNTANDWSKYICDYASGAAPLKLDVANFEEKMLKVAALAIAAVETSRRNGGPAKRHYD